MTTPKSLLDEALEAWRYAREGVIAEVRNLPSKSFDFRPAPEVRSVTELVQHIVESGQMMAGELSRADGNFQRQPFDRFLAEYARGVDRHRSKDQLLLLLTRAHADGDRKIRAAGEVQMLQQIVQFNGVPATRLSWMSHGIAHEEYHRGQLALYARLLGRVPALTKRIMGG